MVQRKEFRVTSFRWLTLHECRPCLGIAGAIALFLLLCWTGGAHAFVARHNMKHIYQKQVEALEIRWRDAELTGNLDELDDLLSDDYIGITVNGTVQTKEETLERIKNHVINIKKMDLSELKAVIRGDTAVVTSKAQVEGDINGIEANGTFRYTRVYLRRAGVWKIINFEATRINPRGERRGSSEVNPAGANPTAESSPKPVSSASRPGASEPSAAPPETPHPEL